MTLLLVSPKNLSEAISAYKGGADIIDIKNPEEGSLGANFPWVISEIREAIPDDTPISATIGDVPYLPGTVSLAAYGVAKSGADIIKVGIKGPQKRKEAVDLMKKIVKAVCENSPKVVACGYGDYKRCGTINPILIPEVTYESGSDIAMLDTAIKDGNPLTRFLSYEKLEDFIQKSHSLGLQATLAGSLGPKEILNLKNLDLDIVGVRGAVCQNRDRRKGMISKESVKKLKSLLED